MAFIVSSSFDGDKSIALLGEQIARTTVIGSNWTALRIGMRFAVSNSLATADTIIGPELAFGLNSGTSSLFADPSPTHFIGIHSITSQTWTEYGVGNGNIGYSAGASNVLRYIKKVGATTQEFGDCTPSFSPIFGGNNVVVGNPRRTLWFIDFFKTAADPGRWVINSYTPVANSNSDITSASFYTFMAAPTNSIASEYHLVGTTIPITESVNGHLDTVNIYWSIGNRQIEVSDVAIYRFA